MAPLNPFQNSNTQFQRHSTSKVTQSSLLTNSSRLVMFDVEFYHQMLSGWLNFFATLVSVCLKKTFPAVNSRIALHIRSPHLFSNKTFSIKKISFYYLNFLLITLSLVHSCWMSSNLALTRRKIKTEIEIKTKWNYCWGGAGEGDWCCGFERLRLSACRPGQATAERRSDDVHDEQQ